LRASERQQLRELYDFCCGYCGVSETDIGSELTRDHFQPTSQGGSDTLANYVYSCHACNEFKSDFWQEDTTSTERVLHPLRDDLSQHISLDVNGLLLGLTETGNAHIAILHLNRPALVSHRRRAMREQAREARIVSLESEVRDMGERIEGLLQKARTDE
jgi:hypothetical protein